MDKTLISPVASFIDLLMDVVCVVDVQGHFVFVSAAAQEVFGYSPEEMLGKRMIEMVHPDDRARTLKAAGEIMAGHPQLHFENRYCRKDGQYVHIMWSARWSEADQLRIAVARNISARKQAQAVQAALYAISEAAHAAEDLLALFRGIHQIIGELLPVLNFSVALANETSGELEFAYHADALQQLSDPNPVSASLLGSEVLRSGQPLLLTPATQDLSAPLQALLTRNAGVSWLGVPLNSHNGIVGALVLESRADGALYGEKDRELLQYVSTQIAAAIERKQLYSRLQHIAQHDLLTQLPNRALLHDRMRNALNRAQRERGHLALLYLDLDKFKQINDQFGHACGDQLLQAVAQRMRQSVRAMDTVARFGGDEFVVLLDGIQLAEHATQVAEKILQALSQPLDIDGQAILILPSIGIALYPEHGEDIEQLLKHADGAMYAAKQQGGNRIHPVMPDAPLALQA